MNRDGGDSFCHMLGGGTGPIHALTEFWAWIFGARRHTLPGLGLALMEKLKDNKEKEHYEMLNCLRTKLSTLLDKNGVLIFPTFPVPAQYHNQPLSTPFDFPYTAIFNALGFPTCTVPLGLARVEEVPIGIQVVAGLYQDRLAIAIAEELERGSPAGWLPPSVVELNKH